MMSEETTTDRLAEIEGQAADYTPPEGWRVLRAGEVLQGGDEHVSKVDNARSQRVPIGNVVPQYVRYIRRIEPEQAITPDDVAAEAINEWPSVKILQQEMEATELALLEQQQRNEQLVTHSSRQHIEIAELQAQVRFLKNRELTLGTRLEEEKAVTAKRQQQVEELRSEVSHVQRLWGESRRRVEELEQKLAESQTVVVQQQNLIQNRLTMDEATEPEPQPQPVHLQAMLDSQAETVARLHSEINALNTENVELETQLEAVKAEVVQERLERNRWHNQVLRVTAELEDKTSECRNLRIELDALQQAPQAEPAATVPTSTDDRFEEGWDAGTARAVETIAEWTEPFRVCGSQGLALAVMQNLPHIMRTLTGLTDED